MGSRLPIRIRPATNEIAVSYLTRLATLHQMPLPELWTQVSRARDGTSTRRLDPDRYAAVVDQPRHRLARAIIELHDPEPDWLALRHEPQHGCHRCAATHPGPPLQLLGHHHMLCLRHRIWIGPPDLTGFQQPDLGRLPEVVAAQRSHLRLLRRLGPAATFDAVLTGFLICAHRWSEREPPPRGDARHHWDKRAQQLIPAGSELGTFTPSKLFAATYPEAVDLAEILGTLRWRRLAAGDPDMQQRFTTEIGRRLGRPDYQPKIARDAIAHWIDQDCWRPPSRPIHDYRSQRTYGGPSYRKPQARNEDAQLTSAAWFAQHRCGGDAMLHHRSLAPVITRQWAEPNTLFETAIRATATVSLTRQEHTARETQPITARLAYHRPQPAPQDYLTDATEPAPWPPPQPRQDPPPRPWSASERPYFTPRPRQLRKFRNR
ncbi:MULTISPECIES: hypothetical protein [Nocardia]|uniref:hypothetical protein n=1 Tax=Nocardia TaxID=1817 RepID=UPI001CBC5D5D|nr:MULTISPECIES: hypothetical protein [Nocardia]UAK36158.1 hypothetical protein K8O92_33310 [Nocardia asteroides]